MDARPRGPNQPINSTVARLSRVPISARATGSMRTTVRLRMAYNTSGRVKCLPLPRDQQAEEEEHRKVEQLAPILGELDTVFAGILESHLHRQPRDERGDEHARASGLGRHQAEQRQRDQAKLVERFGHPSLAVRQAQQPASDQADPGTDERSRSQAAPR